MKNLDLLSDNFLESILIEPVKSGADSLRIISSYAAPTMLSYYFLKLKQNHLRIKNLELISGMTVYDGMSLTAHNGFKSLVTDKHQDVAENLECYYIYRHKPVNSNLYLWLKNGKPFYGWCGSLKFLQNNFLEKERSAVARCNEEDAQYYFELIMNDAINCMYHEIEEYVRFEKRHSLLDEEYREWSVNGKDTDNRTFSFLNKKGETGRASGLNWGQRKGRNKNEAYIPIPIETARSGFFPDSKMNFFILTDDHHQLLCRIEQQNDKALTTPLSNALLGEYFRNRMGLANGAYVSRGDLEKYGRTDVNITKIDNEIYYMDFHV